MTIEWKKSEGKWTSGEMAYSGKIALANVYWDGMRPRGDELKYKVTFMMPQPPKSLSFETQEEGKAYAEKGIRTWLKWANLQPSNKSEVPNGQDQ